jgi:hypothetical protein
LEEISVCLSKQDFIENYYIELASVLHKNPVTYVTDMVLLGLQVQVSIGEKMLVGLATGTAVFLTPLPMPPIPKVSAGNSWADDKKLAEIQKLLQDTVKKNREIYQLKPLIVRGRLVVYTLIHMYGSTFVLGSLLYFLHHKMLYFPGKCCIKFSCILWSSGALVFFP